jgi:hypothetical protein
MPEIPTRGLRKPLTTSIKIALILAMIQTRFSPYANERLSLLKKLIYDLQVSDMYQF